MPLIRLVVRTAASESPASGPAGGMTSVPPAPKAMHSSPAEMSKPGDPSWMMRLAGPSPRPRTRVSARPAMPWCVTTTPLGRPEVPEVYVT